MRRALSAVAALAVTACFAQDAKRLGHSFSAPEAVYKQSNVYRVTQTLDKQPPVVLVTEADYTIQWKNEPAKEPGKVALRFRRIAGELRVSSGDQKASWRYGDPESPEKETIEKLFGPPTRGWDFTAEKATGKLALDQAFGADGKPRERTDFDEMARQQLEAELAEYIDRPADKGASWETRAEVPIADDLKMGRTFKFVVQGDRQYKGARCAIVRVENATWEPKGGKSAVKVLSSAFEREDLFDLDHGLLAKSLIDSTIRTERKVAEGTLVEEQKTEIRWTLESIGKGK